MADWPVKPTVMIMNMALHSSQDDVEEVVEEELQDFISLTNDLYDDLGVRMLYHSPTYVKEDMQEKLENKNILAIDRLLRDSLEKWRAVDDRYLDIYNYTRSLANVPHCGRPDGIHFEGWCNYQAMVTQLDFNWLESMGIIETGQLPSVVRVKKVNHGD